MIKNIAFVVPGLDPTGPIFVVQSLIIELVAKGYNVDLYYLNERTEQLKFPCKTININLIGNIDFSQYDVVHSHCFSADRYIFKNRKKLGNAKWVTTIHQDTITSFAFSFPKFIAKLLGRYWLKMQDKADAVVAISNQIRDTYQPYFSKPAITIYNGVNVETDIKLSDNQIKIKESIHDLKNHGYKLIGTYANIVKCKGLDQVLKVMKINDTFHFIIIGDGEYKETLQNLTTDMKLDDRVHFYPFVTNPYLCIEDLDAYIMPSYSEGFGLSLLESAIMGKAIICSELPSFCEIFTPSDVRFFKLNDLESLSDAINYTLENKATLSERSTKRARDFTKQIMAEKYLELYQSL